MKNKNGFTLIDVLIGTALLVIIIISFYGLLQLGIKVVAQSKARITATTLSNQRIETFKNLPYNQVGTFGGIPPGNIPETEVFIRNNIEFTVKTTINYIDDPFDGVAPNDIVPNDYKKVKVKTTWTGFLGGEVILITDIAPRGLESIEGGGNLLISAFDALGAPIGQANIHLVNNSADPPINANYQTNDQGQFLVAGAPSSTAAYEITVAKPSFSANRTYGTDEVANPEKPHATVIEGMLTEISFSIDQLASFLIKTLSPWGTDNFADSFLNQDLISELFNISVEHGETTLATSTEGYLSSGYLISNEIISGSILNWNQLSWNDNEPINTLITYQLYYATTTNWFLIPDIDLAENSIGFEEAPIDLSELSINNYPKLKIRGNLQTINTSTTPTLFDWNISWITAAAIPISNVSFNMRGNKIIGTDELEQSVYKYSSDFTTNANGEINIADLEWDQYNFTINPAESLDLISTNPESDPLGQDIDLLPNEYKTISLYLDSENSLLFTVNNSETTNPIFNAQVHLYDGGLYDQIQFTDEQGQTLFIPLETGNYSIEIQADGYNNYFGSINVSGDITNIINLTLSGPS